jgi:uncharacterized damage-inducible protein DinB
MNVNFFRHFYGYHFTENRKIWDRYITPLSYEQFTQALDYSHGSIRNQIVHLMEVDDAWFSDLRGDTNAVGLYPPDIDDRNVLRTHWDGVEHMMQAYLDNLRDDQLVEQPLKGEDKDLYIWQVLLHVANHGTDHRAQILRALKDVGVSTAYQDYIFYAYETPAPKA